MTEFTIDSSISRAFNWAVSTPKNKGLWEKTRITHTREFWDSVENDVFNEVGPFYSDELYIQDCIEELARDYYLKVCFS